ncbi:sensor histidine kinase [Flaviaesturariibacter terrae]
MGRVLFSLLFFLPFVTAAQADSLLQVPGTPSKEIYDLLRDRNGFVWLGHNGGISRYDGQRFLSFSNRQQNGLSVTDLCEDRQGRIWCHNFEGQILYVAQNKLHVLSAFRFWEEAFYPRIAIFGEELVSCSSKGFFTCNTRDLSARYYPLRYATTSLSVLSNGVLAWMPGEDQSFWWYQAGKGIRRLKTRFRLDFRQDAALQPETFRDTAFLVSNPKGIYYKLWVTGDSLYATPAVHCNEFINAITVDGDEAWVHTGSASWSTSGKTVRNQFLTNALSNVQGHTFYSSLRRGLLKPFDNHAVPAKPSFLGKDDYVRSLQRTGPRGELFGTQLGHIYYLENGVLRGHFKTAARYRAVERLFALGDSQFLVASSLGLHALDLKEGRLRLIDSQLVVKDLALQNDRLVLATTIGVLPITRSAVMTSSNLWSLVPFNRNWRRARTVCFTPEGALFSSYNEGLFCWRDHDSSLVTFAGERVYSTRVRNFEGKLLIASFNQGLLLYDKGKIVQLNGGPDGADYSVVDLKVSGHSAWAIYEDQVQEVDPHFHIRAVNGMPFTGSEVFDISEEDSGLLVATAQGLFHVPRTPVPMPATHTLIDAVRVNDSLPGPAEGGHFSHRHNNVSLTLSTPWFGGSSHLRYRYRLCTDGGCSWLLSGEGQNSFTFVNLAPGSYTFSAVAVNGIGAPLAPELSYSFVIDPPWWATWWARTLEVLALMSIFFLLGLYLQRRRSRRQRTRYERLLAVEHERQRISAEIHDDLGATLSGVRLLTELAREKMPPGPLQVDLEKIHQSISSLTEKTREVIWTLNTEQDSLESLLLYLQKQAQALFEGAPTRLQVQLPVEVPPVRVSGDVRRQVYLAVREALHNCLKHSGASLCRLSMTYGPEGLRIEVHDDGAGLPAQRSSSAFSSGMRSMQQRMAYTGGQLRIHSNPKQGTRIEFIIPLSQNG